jgi:hypothetical protein
VVVQTDLMLDAAAAVDILHDKRQVPDAQLVPELLGKLPGQGSIACLADAHSPAGQEPVTKVADGT